MLTAWRLMQKVARSTIAPRILSFSAVVLLLLSTSAFAAPPPPPPPLTDPADFDGAPDEVPETPAPKEKRKKSKHPTAPPSPGVSPSESDPAAFDSKIEQPASEDDGANDPEAFDPDAFDSDFVDPDAFDADDPRRPKADVGSLKIPTSQSRPSKKKAPSPRASSTNVPEVALWQATASGAAIFLASGPIVVLSYCTLGAFGCLVWPALQGALVTWVGNGVSKQAKGFLLPAVAGVVAQMSMLMAVFGFSVLLPGVGPFIPPIPGVNPVFLVYPIVGLLMISPAIAAAASIGVWHFDVEGSYEADAWSKIPPFFTVPYVEADPTRPTPLSALPHRQTVMRF